VVAEVAMIALVDVLDNPRHRWLSRDKNADGPTLYHAVAASRCTLDMQVTGLMWATATIAADVVLGQLDAGGYKPGRLMAGACYLVGKGRRGRSPLLGTRPPGPEDRRRGALPAKPLRRCPARGRAGGCARFG
jgi:hypothetical protein